MSPAEMLQQAIRTARAGRKEEARDLLLQVVEAEPRNELAWIWLSGLVDSLEDRIIACENVLAINPANDKIRAYLAELQQRSVVLSQVEPREEAADLFLQARTAAERNDRDEALRLARQAVEKEPAYEPAWALIGKLSRNLEEQLLALERAYRLNPSNPETISELKQARYLKTNPLNMAKQLEQQGRFEEALRAYEEAAPRSRNSQEFDQIYKQILRIEGLKREKIRYVAPASTITRLTFGWPFLYLSLVLVQVGLNPFAHPAIYLWLGFPFVILGGFLLSLAEVRTRHMFWQKLFAEQGDGSDFARLVTAATGWFLIIVPHVLIVFDSLNRLRYFTIPPMPF